MNYVTDIDRDKALLLIDSSIQAYTALSGAAGVKPPAGFELVDTWTGVDNIFGMDKTIESYGVVFRSLKAPYTYVFAFRGTATIMDILDDMGAQSRDFTPFDRSVSVDSAVRVEAGFFDVYSDSDDETPSMQTQVFGLLDKYLASDKPVDRLYITGHSLGASLSELFTIDVALSRPDLKNVSNYNYACPRVGNAAFVDLCMQQPAQQDPTTRTLRIQNTHDRVPCVPPEALGYRHLPYAYLVSFVKDSWSGIDLAFIVHNHASGNYQAVLQCALKSPTGVCVNDALVVSGEDYKLKSQKPDPDDVCCLW